jgi:hypothetical protein
LLYIIVAYTYSITSRGIDRENNSDKEDKSREGSGIDRENNSNKEDKSREGSRIDRENNGKNKDD